MPDSVNPYIPGQPVDDPDLFFGRREILASIREHLLKGRRVFVVSAAPRMGKTSLLRQLPAHLPEEFLSLRVDLLAEDTRRLDWLLWRLAEAVDDQVARSLGAERLKPEWADFEGQTGRFLEHFWPQIRAIAGDRSLVLLVDDLDSPSQATSHLLNPFLTFLSTLREEDEALAIVLTTTEAQAEALAREHPRLFGGALTYTLGPLGSEAATRLITWPVDGVITYDYGVARRLIEATSGHPYYLQLLCFEVFNRCAPAGWVNQRDVDLVVEDLVGREIADFRHVWEESSPREQAALAALVSLRGARGVATVQEVRTVLTKAGARADRGQVTLALEDLVARGILERLGALSYRFRVALLRDWLCERIDLKEVVHDTRWGAPGKGGPAAGKHVSRLRPGKRQRAKRPPTPAPARQRSEAGEGESEGPPSRRPPRLWLMAVALLSLLAVSVVVVQLLQSPPPEPIPTVTLVPTATARLATATHTVEVKPTARPVALVSPSDTAVPSPTPSPLPTPPIVVARSVPSIAYQSKSAGERSWSIYVMSSDGGNRLRLGESQTGFLSPPTWSPDGSRIAFVSDRDGNQDIWVMDSDGSNPVNLTHEQAKDYSPAWSPLGDWIAFASVRDSPYWELYLMRPDGSDVQRLTWWEDASDWSPSWSPDGTRLAFASKRDGNWEIYTMDRDGSNLVRLTDNLADDTNPAWSPDGSRIAFESMREGYTDIFVMPAVGGQATNLTNLPWATDLGPTWSPDGGRIAFYSDRDGDWDIYLMASDGSDVVKLTGDNTNDQLPAWRP
jgi:dipeptidyl aminopeptidase/acylaminoacyl peptidase